MPQANCPHGSTTSSSLAHGCSFRLMATPEQLPSPKQRLEGANRRTAASPDPFALLIGLGCPGGTRDGVGFSPVSVDSHCVQASPPITPTARSDQPYRVLRRNPPGPLVLPQAWELGTPSRPKRDPSRTILAWPLRRRPLRDDAGCIPLRRRVRARISARVRPRTGRIRSIGVGSIAPFMTEPTTPAAHAKPEAQAKDGRSQHKPEAQAKDGRLQIAPDPWIWAVHKERPDLRGLVHSQEGHRRICLPLRQRFPRVVGGRQCRW